MDKIIEVGNDETLSRLVQEKLFSMGYQWSGTGVGYFTSESIRTYGIYAPNTMKLYAGWEMHDLKISGYQFLCPGSIFEDL